MQCTENGFQTLEVLREGLWASFTGGWFYDLRQSVFCNTFHLYLWLFLLCFPFIIHLYFPPSILVSGFYCGTVGIVFIFLKLINHRLHRLFDTSECIQETIPGEDLPESQKKRTQISGTKAVLEDEWFELKELNGSKVTSDIPSHASFQEATDDDSINSSEATGRPVSSTIDLKVDVHHKNSSESSEDLSLKPVIEDEPAAVNESEECGLLKEGKVSNPDAASANVRGKHNQLNSNKLRLKNEEGISGIQDAELIFSLSDCHIAKLRNDSMDDLTEEYKISQSECQISKFFHNNDKEQAIAENASHMPAGIKKFNTQSKEHNKKKYRKGFSRHLGADASNEKCSTSSDKNDCFDIANFTSNGSCGVLTLNQNNKEQLKNTGSLELPLKDTENNNLEKGLLYWKQQNLDSNRVENLRETQHVLIRPCNKLHVCSESNIHSPDKSDVDNTIKRLKQTIDTSDAGNQEGKRDNDFQNCSSLYQDVNEQNNEQSFLEILEENFDWYSSEYQEEKTEKKNLAKSKINNEISKFKSDENIREEKIFDGLTTKSDVKFQIDSDDDSSDNCGSRSPLLCRHESLEKENQERKSYLYGDKGEKKMARTFSNEENNGRGFNKMVRTLSVDEDAVLSRRYKTSEILPKVDRGAFGSVVLSVYDDDDIKNFKGMKRGGSVKRECENERSKDSKSKSCKSGVKRHSSSLYSNKKLALTSPIHVDEMKSEEERKSARKNEKLCSKDVLSWSNERVGLEWLFEHTDSETDNQPGKSDASKNSSSNVSRPPQSQGAIPKTRTKMNNSDRSNSRYRSNESKSGKLRSKINSYSDEFENFDLVGQIQKDFPKKPKNERENEIIDEEDISVESGINEIRSEGEEKQIRSEKALCRRENYDSSNNSNFELSSLLPLSSLLSSLNPPSSPLLAAFLATRKDLPGATQHPGIDSLTTEEKEAKGCNDEALGYHPGLTRNRNKRIRRPNTFQRSSRSSIPLAALASVISNNSGTHIATSHDDTSQGAVHCFQDERGNWISYTFDCFSGGANHIPTLSVGSSHYNCNNSNNNHGSNNNSNSNNSCSTAAGRSGNGESAGSNDNSKQVQSILRRSYLYNRVLRDRDKDVNFSSATTSRMADETSRPQWNEVELTKYELSRRILQNVPTTSKHQKYGETCDSNINLVSNSNSENESSLSLNSANVSPGVEIGLQRPSFNFGRERMVLSRCSLGNNNNNGNGVKNKNSVANPNSNSGPIILSLGEFSNSNSDNNNNNGRNSNFYLEVPFHLLSESERSRQRNVLHSPTGIPDFRSSLNAMPDGNDSETKRNLFCMFDLDLESSAEVKKKQRHYYKLYYSPFHYIKIRFDRLELIALLDRNLTIFEVVLSLLLSFAVSACGITLLNYGFYRDLVALLFCFTIAGCHYSLLKSVQPDATSPTHGYNRVVIYSRSIYFCIASLSIIALTSNLDRKENRPFNFYSLQMTDSQLFKIIRDGLVYTLLLFPIFFTLGVFPQINTFSLYILEQIDLHVLGGNAMSNLIGSVYCVVRSVATIVLIYGFAYGALSEAKTSQHILFSIFSGLLIALSYHLSRSSSNPNIVWEILKNHLFQDELLGKNYSGQFGESKGSGSSRKNELNKSAEDSLKSERANKNGGDGDDKSDDKNSQNNLLLNSNPSSNETLKTIDTHAKSNFSENFDGTSGNASEIYNMKKESDKEEFVDPLPGKLKETVNARLKNDAIICCFIAVLVFALHSSTVFTALQPDLNPILWGIAGCSGIVLHYIVPQLRKQLPWLCMARPILRSYEHRQFEVRDAAKVMWFEETFVILRFLERNLLYPVLVLATLTCDAPKICETFGIPFGALITTICGLKMMRSSFSNTSQQYLIMQFVVTYIAPWQITWGSTFHAFAQLFSVPHSALLLFQTALSALLSAPLNPFLGSALFFASYVRPVKFWERDYNTKRVDHSNTRLSSHLERNLGSDDNNLNSIFYEHLTRSLQHNLCGDLELGRWGPAHQGDCFILASDYLNCLVHIIEMGNGLVTFQMRGLEFRGTFCQQREVEAISEGVEENDGCCCCQPGHLPNMLSVNAAFSQRWLAWEVTSTKYVLEGYSISDNSAKSMLQVFDFRKVLVTYYVKSIIFYCIRSPKLNDWLSNSTILAALEPISDRSFVDLDPVFNVNSDQDFDIRAEGITRTSFCNVYLEWIQYCASKREKPIDKSKNSSLISLCLALSLMGRRTLGTASHNTVSNVEFFLHGLHALFKGDFRITSVRDEWIFSDMEFLKKVVAPGVRMSLKLHQDHFMSPEEYENPEALFEAISNHEENLVISHEGDPAWRGAVLSGTPSLLALRHALDDGADEYKIIMLNKRYLSFRVIKLNRECVRGLWAGQQQELVFFRNRNPERGSIQNAKQVLRNIINSSCDQPIGYPIYVSPLTTSYADTNKQYTDIIGGPLSLKGLKDNVLKLWCRIRQRCREGCSSGSAGNMDEGGFTFGGHDAMHASTNMNISTGYGHNTSGSQSMDSSQMQLGGSNRGGSLGRSSLGGRGSLPSVGKPSSATLASLAGLLSSAELSKGESFLRERETSFTFMKERTLREEKESSRKLEDVKKAEELKVKFDDRGERRKEGESRKDKEKRYEYGDDGKEKEHVYQRVRIIDPNQVFDAINLGRRIDVLWPDEGMRARGGRSHWKDWLPDSGMEGQVVHRWIPNHRDPSKRSNVDKTILLVKIDDRYVPIAEAGVQDLGAEV